MCGGSRKGCCDGRETVVSSSEIDLEVTDWMRPVFVSCLRKRDFGNVVADVNSPTRALPPFCIFSLQGGDG